MQSVASRLEAVAGSLPQHVSLVAVSKFHPAEAIRQAYDAGQRIFAESRVQEIVAKIPQLPADIRWHFIGHLQTNKVKPVVAAASLIESIDSERLLMAVDREAERQGKRMDVLLQVHVAREETKFGFSPEELLDLIRRRVFENLKAVHICGLMAMASNTDDTDRVRDDFMKVAALRDEVMRIAPDLRGFDILSMGMSHDYMTAIECGSNMVRVGTAIFGERV